MIRATDRWRWLARAGLTPPRSTATLVPLSTRRYRILVCRGPECGDRRNSRAVYDAFHQALAAHGLESRCELGWQSCFGRCTQGPNALVRELVAGPPSRFILATLPGPRGITALYNHLDVVKVADVVAHHVVADVVVRRYVEPPSAVLATAQGEPPTGESR